MSTTGVVDIQNAQDSFVEMLPDIACIAGRAFSDLNLDAREEAVAEATAMAWKNHVHCVAEEKSIGAPSLAHYAIQGVRSGRRFAGSSSTDVLSPRAQIMGRARVQSLNVALPQPDDDGTAWWTCTQALVDKRIWEHPPERVRIKLDYVKFLALPHVTLQEREVFNLLARGYGTGEIAQRLEVSAPRICQLKRAIADKLTGFFGPDIGPGGRAQRKVPETASQAR